MTIDEILKEAFKKIHDEHRVALRHVYFDTIDGSADSGDIRLCTSVKIEGDTLHGEPYKRDEFRPMKPLIDQLADDLKVGGKFAREFEALYGLKKR